jgi:prepilin-type N-terminal cleavage/methylation domain-containing protein
LKEQELHKKKTQKSLTNEEKNRYYIIYTKVASERATMLAHRFKKFSQGFTLIELLVVIAIIAALAVVVFVALNPAQRLKDSRDARRTSDVDSILTAVHEYIVDNKGSLPAGLTAGMIESQLGTSGTGCTVSTAGCAATASACVDLTTPMAKYLKSIPIDPNGTAAKTNYSIAVDTNGIVTVKACGTEGTSNISASR